MNHAKIDELSRCRARAQCDATTKLWRGLYEREYTGEVTHQTEYLYSRDREAIKAVREEAKVKLGIKDPADPNDDLQEKIRALENVVKKQDQKITNIKRMIPTPV